ncbi:MAG: hypothetical protein AB7O28_09700 [Vicinamibacterales bacterium]
MTSARLALAAPIVVALASILAIGGSAQEARPQGGIQYGGTNPDGSLRPARPVTRLFTQDAYTQYEILEPGSESFRIKFLPETGPGSTELVNATRGGSEGSGVEVYDPRTGEPLPFTYEEQANGDHAIHARLPMTVPEGGIGRVLIYKTYKDPRTYMMNGRDVIWVRSLAGYRLGVILPRGFRLVSSDVAAQLSTLPDGRVKLAFANPSGQSNPVTIHATPTTVAYTAAAYDDMFFDDIKTLYDLGDPAAGTFQVEQIYSDYRKGATAAIDATTYLPLQQLSVVDLDTARPLATKVAGGTTTASLAVPIANDRQSAHLKVTGMVKDGSYTLAGGELVFTRTLKGLRNTVLLPQGYEVTACSQSGTVGRTREGRAFVALINLNAENAYGVTIRARK